MLEQSDLCGSTLVRLQCDWVVPGAMPVQYRRLHRSRCAHHAPAVVCSAAACGLQCVGQG